MDERKGVLSSHAQAAGYRIGFFKKASGTSGISYAEALDEALCFGRIDGVRKNINAISYSIRVPPRRPKSIWSQLRPRRMSELTALGLMRPTGVGAGGGAG